MHRARSVAFAWPTSRVNANTSEVSERGGPQNCRPRHGSQRIGLSLLQRVRFGGNFCLRFHRLPELKLIWLPSSQRRRSKSVALPHKLAVGFPFTVDLDEQAADSPLNGLAEGQLLLSAPASNIASR
jgi:hypothetical protein